MAEMPAASGKLDSAHPTAEMIKAGVQALERWQRHSTECLVAEIYRAMKSVEHSANYPPAGAPPTVQHKPVRGLFRRMILGPQPRDEK